MKNLIFFAVSLFSPIVSHAEKVVVIDPGHGGGSPAGTMKARTLSSDNNAVSPSGLKEKDLTLELCLEIERQFLKLENEREKGVSCVLTRKTDVNPNFAERAAVCLKQKSVPTAFVSVHFNASDNHKSLGTLAMVQNAKLNAAYARDRDFAFALTKATNTAVSRFVSGSKPLAPITDGHLHGGLGSNVFFQLAQHKILGGMPRCFLEVEFMDRVDVDAKLLRRRKEAFPEIARAIAAFLYEHAAADAKP